MKIFSDSKNLIAMLILGLVIIAAIVFLARPLTNQCLAIYKENKDKRAEIESYDQNLNNLKSIEAQIEDINYTITKADQFIPAEENINDFIVQLEGAAKKSKISLTSIELKEDKSQPSQNADNKNGETKNQPTNNNSSNNDQKTSKVINVSGANEVAIKVEVQGKYSRLVSFLGRMKQLSRFNIIKNLSFQSSGENTNITGSFYVIIFNRG